MSARAASLFCSDISREAGEPLAGTAPRVDVWFMIEVAGAWDRKAFEASALPLKVKDHLTAAKATIPHARIELIQQQGRRPNRDFAFLVARSSDRSPALYQFALESYEDLVSLDLADIANGSPRYESYRITKPRYLVCTNGSRDQCCARNGIAAYHMLTEHAGDSVWQCTHLGGHRLSANVVALPDGLLYGRVTAEDVVPILQTEHIHLRALRGRTCYEAPAQAAEIYLRESSGKIARARLTLAGLTATGDHRWEVRFDGAPKDQGHLVRVEQVAAGYKTYDSCDSAEPGDVHEFRLSGISQVR